MYQYPRRYVDSAFEIENEREKDFYSIEAMIA